MTLLRKKTSGNRLRQILVIRVALNFRKLWNDNIS